jgi:sulfur carrier protein
MQLTVNGETRTFPEAPESLEALLAALSFPRERVAVELNGALVPRRERGATPVRDGDVVEVVTLVGGG